MHALVVCGISLVSRLGANKQRAEQCVPRFEMPGPEAASATCCQVKAPKRDDIHAWKDFFLFAKQLRLTHG